MGIVWASIFWLLGIFIGRTVLIAPFEWCVLGATALLASLCLFRHPRQRNLFLLILAFTLAGIRARSGVKEPGPSDLGFYNDLDVQARVTGTVIADPDQREDHTALHVRAERLIIPSLDIAQPIEGEVLVHANPYEAWEYGDWVRINGRLETPPSLDGFSYRDYLARRGIYSWITQAYVTRLGAGRGSFALQWIYQLRHRLHATLGRIFPEPEASLTSGILLGIESEIPKKLYEQFSRTGTTHIIAISGFNITLIANLIISSSRRIFGARRGLWVALTGISLYTILVGADAAVVRAAVMGGLALFARYWGRDTLGLSSLGASSVLMTAVNPAVLWDIGFQLSFAATLGLILYAGPLHSWAVGMFSKWMAEDRAKQIGGLTSEYLLYTVAAQVTTWPLTMIYFQRFSIVAFITNPLILPLQPALMILAGAAALVGTIWLPAGSLMALLAWPFPALTIRIVSFMARFASGGLGISSANFWLPLAYYALLLAATVVLLTPRVLKWFHRFLRIDLSRMRARHAWVLAALALSTGVVWQSGVRSADGNLHITFLDVGAGDAILVLSPSGEWILIDGGGSHSRLMNHLGRELPMVGRRLSALIVAGTSTNQTTGLVGLVDHIRIDQVLLPDVFGSYSYRRLKQELLSNDIQSYSAERNQQLEIGGGAQIDVVECTNTGLVLLLSYRDARILIPAGLTPDSVEYVADDQRVHAVNVLLLASGGQQSVNPLAWLEATNPQLAILSKGTAQSGADQLVKSPAFFVHHTLLRTDLHGSVTLHTDGRELWVETERPAREN